MILGIMLQLALSELLLIHDHEVWSYRGVVDENNVVVSAREVERTRICATLSVVLSP